MIGVDGELEISRLNWNDVFARAGFGTPLRDGDLLRVPEHSQATIVCADLRISQARSGVASVPCDVVSETIALHPTSDSPSLTLRSPPGAIPQLIAPRNTKIRTAQPTIRWKAVEDGSGATTYLVNLRRGSDVIWSQEVRGATEVVYPGTPSLEPGVTYVARISVGAGGHGPNSSQETGEVLSFTMLTTGEASTVDQFEQSISDLDIPDGHKRFLRAKLYRSQGLRQDAIEVLTNLTDSLPSTHVHLELGDLYIEVGLPEMAEGPYRRALDRAVDEEDIEGQARAHYGMGAVLFARGSGDAAREEINRAIDLYRQLGDTSTVTAIEVNLAERFR